MIDELPIQYRHDEMELNAYNAAFYDLGFRWYWDRDTYLELISRNENAADQIQHYLRTRQPHLLTAYDEPFLIELIQQKKTEHRKRGTVPQSARPCHFDWARALDGELGA